MRRMLSISASIALAIGLMVSPAMADWVDEDGHKMHYPQHPDVSGWDVNATSDPEAGIGVILADDWLCTQSGPVTDVHFWGSWKHGIEGQIIGFWLSIHANDPGPPSKPDITLWERFTEDFIVADPHDPPASQGWYDPMTGEVIPDDHVPYFLYNITNIPDPFIQEEGTIYWLNVTAVVVDPVGTQWGWKSTLENWEDDAVWGRWGLLDWQEMYDPMPEPPLVNSFWAFWGPGGELLDGQGDGQFPDWYYYENFNWWNVWFYDHPLVTGKKQVHVEFDAFGPGVYTALFAVNWSTDQWEPGGPPPLPPLSPTEEEMFIGREEFQIVEGHNIIDFTIPHYNPEWISVDFMVLDYMDVPLGWIEHQCIPSLDLAFVITGEEVPETGACCFPDDTCFDLFEPDCIAQGGDFRGSGTICLGDNNGNGIDDACEEMTPGACCFPDGLCTDLNEPDCIFQGGIYLGPGTACIGDNNGNGIDDACEEALGACCWPNGLCTLEIEADCTNNGGNFLGYGVPCEGDNNGNGIDDACEVENIPTLSEWGMIILGLLLLTAGTIAIVRRRKAAVSRTN
jgi:hypothetical protein